MKKKKKSHPDLQFLTFVLLSKCKLLPLHIRRVIKKVLRKKKKWLLSVQSKRKRKRDG